MYMFLCIYSFVLMTVFLWKYWKTRLSYIRLELLSKIICFALMILDLNTFNFEQRDIIFINGVIAWICILFNTYSAFKSYCRHYVEELYFKRILQYLNVNWQEFRKLNKKDRKEYAYKNFPDNIVRNEIIVDDMNICTFDWLLKWN